VRSEKESMNKELIAHTIATVNFQRGGEFFTEKEANGTPVVAADAESITFSVGYFSRGIVFFTGRNICDTLGGGCCRRGPVFETQTVKWLLLLWKSHSWFYANFKTF